MLLYNFLHVNERLENNTVSDSSSMETANMAVTKMYSKTEDCHLFLFICYCLLVICLPLHYFSIISIRYLLLYILCM